MLCLPQAFELFLKHLVGGLHTVYTKLKRLEITPIVCNVEQVRILRGLGAIQPGVNRCKLLADCDFDSLYKDCTTSSSRPGRPPKRGVPFPPMSPQDAMMHLKNMHNGAHAQAGAGVSDPYKDGPFPKEPRLDKNPFGNGFGPPGGPAGLNPMAAQFMALQHPAFLSAAQVNAAGGMPAPFGLPNPSVVTSSPSIPGRPEPQFMKGPNAASLASLEALQRSGFFGAAGAAYIERMREGHKTLAEHQQQKEQQGSPHQETPQGQPQSRPGFEPSSNPLGPLNMPGQVRHPPLALQADMNKRSSSSDSFCKDDRSDSPILNLSSKSANDNQSDLSADDDVYVSDNDDDLASNEEQPPKPRMDHKDLADIGQRSEDKVNNNGTSALPTQGVPGPGLPGILGGLPGLLAQSTEGGDGQLASVYSLITNIQAMIKVAVENAKKEERSLITEKGGDKTELKGEMDELKKSSQIYLRRFKKEKRYRRKLQEQLEMETKRRLQMEEALRMTSSETLKRISESLTRGSSQGPHGDLTPRLSVGDCGEQDTRDASVADKMNMMNALSSANGAPNMNNSINKDRRDSGDDHRSSPASSSTSNVAIAAAAAAAAAAAQFNATVSTSEASSDRGTPPRDTTAATTTLGFAKNLFPQYNASSLFTSAN